MCRHEPAHHAGASGAGSGQIVDGAFVAVGSRVRFTDATAGAGLAGSATGGSAGGAHRVGEPAPAAPTGAQPRWTAGNAVVGHTLIPVGIRP